MAEFRFVCVHVGNDDMEPTADALDDIARIYVAGDVVHQPFLSSREWRVDVDEDDLIAFSISGIESIDEDQENRLMRLLDGALTSDGEHEAVLVLNSALLQVTDVYAVKATDCVPAMLREISTADAEADVARGTASRDDYIWGPDGSQLLYYLITNDAESNGEHMTVAGWPIGIWPKSAEVLW